jgi:arsenite methyltransferase
MLDDGTNEERPRVGEGDRCDSKANILSTVSSNTPQDKWSTWLRTGRFGGDSTARRQAEEKLKAVRDRVLANAALSGGEVLLDVGTGEGLVGLGALELLRPPGGAVIFSDISQPCLDHVAQALGTRPGAVGSKFKLVSADNLQGINSDSVDVVTSRSVLIYVEDKRQAFSEFFRVLRSGGRISLAEPINRDRARLSEINKGEYYGYDVTPIAELMNRIDASDAARNPDADPMTDFSYLDLVNMCEKVGFESIHIEVACDVTRRVPRSWESFVRFAPNPNAQTIGQELEGFFTAAERAIVERHLRPLVETGTGVERLVMAYLWAAKF